MHPDVVTSARFGGLRRFGPSSTVPSSIVILSLDAALEGDFWSIRIGLSISGFLKHVLGRGLASTEAQDSPAGPVPVRHQDFRPVS